jgi:hypothetical protein
MEDSAPKSMRPGFLEELKRIEEAADSAQDAVDREAAEDQNILFAIEIVEHFLRKRKRVCYGGQAINAHLPAKMKFYDPATTIPDYDFLTPDAEADIKEIVADFRREGYKNISVRMGMHEGTTKVYVDYIPIADITAIHADLYRILSGRSEKIGGIHYIDVNTLRMMMYLELSRPRGEVKRWPKVYERLSLLNAAKPIHGNRCSTEMGLGTPYNSIHTDYFTAALRYIINNKRVLVGAAAVDYYRKKEHLDRSRKSVHHWLFSHKKPLIFYSSAVKEDLNAIAERINKRTHIEVVKSVGEFIPQVALLYVGPKTGAKKYLLAAAIQETACHSYNTAGLYFDDEESIIRIGSLDTLATIYLSFMLSPILEKKLRAPLLCIAEAVVEMGIRNRRRGGTKHTPFISLRCVGHQPRMQSLLREKVERIKAAKEAAAAAEKN